MNDIPAPSRRRPELIIVLVAIIMAVGVWLIWRTGREGATNENVNQPPDTNIQVLSPVYKRTLDSRIEDWTRYRNDNDVELGTRDCGGDQQAAILKQFNDGKKQSYQLNGSLTLVSTPNHPGWTQAQLEAYRNDPKAICAAGGIYPLRAWSDRVLWSGVCGTGLDVDASSPGYNEFQSCLIADQVLKAHVFSQ